MPKFCDKCGSELKNENAKFCDKCGAKVNQNETKSNEIHSTITCQKCNTINPTTATECINCGTPINNENFKYLIILGYVFAIIEWLFGGTNWFFIPLVGLVIAIYLLFKGNLDNRIHAIIIYLLSTISLFFLNWLGYIPLATILVFIILMIIILLIIVIYNKKRYS